MIIAVDAMGGDYAPAEIVKGAAQGSKLYGVDVVLVGDETKIRQCLPPEFAQSSSVTIKHAAETIGMDEHAAAVRTKKDASVVVAASLVKEGKADAMVSRRQYCRCYGRCYACVSGEFPESIVLRLRASLPSGSGGTVMLDAGAVVDCTVEHLKQFAVMGNVYAERVLSIETGRVSGCSPSARKSPRAARSSRPRTRFLQLCRSISSAMSRDAICSLEQLM